MTGTDRRRNWGGLTVGLVLIALGLLFLLREFEVITGSIFIHGWWALLVAGVGLAKLVGSRQAKDLGGGVTLTLIGAWLYLAHTGNLGFTYGNSWPLILVAVGAGMVTRTIASHWMPDRTCWTRGERHV